MPFDPKYYITIKSSNGISISVLAGNSSSVLTDGFGGWESVDRPKRVAMTRWNGKPLFKQDVPVTFDGYSDGKNQEIEISKLVRMSQPAGAFSTPPTIRISGPVDRTDLTWVIENLSWSSDDVIREVIGGASVRMRQSCVIHLMQFVDDRIIVTPAKPQVATKVVDGSDKTLKQHAQDQYGSPDFWTLFIDANDAVFKHPRQKVPKGKKLVVPPKIDRIF